MTQLVSHKTVFVLDHTLTGLSGVDVDMEGLCKCRISSSGTPLHPIPLKAACKTLWTCAVEAITEYCRWQPHTCNNNYTLWSAIVLFLYHLYWWSFYFWIVNIAIIIIIFILIVVKSFDPLIFVTELCGTSMQGHALCSSQVFVPLVWISWLPGTRTRVCQLSCRYPLPFVTNKELKPYFY